MTAPQLLPEGAGMEARFTLGRVFECGWCGRVVEEYGSLRLDFETRQPHVHLRALKGAAS